MSPIYNENGKKKMGILPKRVDRENKTFVEYCPSEDDRVYPGALDLLKVENESAN